MKNIFYFRVINSIGGIETFFYYLAKKYKDWDITIYYSKGDKAQIDRLKQYVRVKQYKGEKIKCDKAFFNFNLDIIDNVEAKEYIQIAHGDYKAMGLRPNTHPKITSYIGVSKQVCETYKEVTGYDTELCYNPIEAFKPKKVLNLISATRLTAEKGKERIKKFAKMLDNEGIPYLWTIFTDNKDIIDNPNIIYAKPRLDIINYIANADYLVQLSDNEGFCYSVVEALSVGTPVIVTDCPVFKEIGVNKDNGFILDFKLEKVPIKEIYKGLKKFEYTPPKDNWDKILKKGKSTYQDELKQKVKVRVIAPYFDLELKEYKKESDPPFTVGKVRADLLCELGLVEEVENGDI
jgi:glycosyltransferase involved in cell wall biosynthesis